MLTLWVPSTSGLLKIMGEVFLISAPFTDAPAARGLVCVRTLKSSSKEPRLQGTVGGKLYFRENVSGNETL